MPELEPGMFERLFAEISAEVQLRAARALEEAAVLVEERARQSVSARAHARRTPTPASPGGPPAMISGTLARSITHSTAAIVAGGIEIRVGMAGGMFNPYYSKTPSSLYARYLEVEGVSRSHVRYPFLKDAFEKTAHPAVLVTFKQAFSAAWPRI